MTTEPDWRPLRDHVTTELHALVRQEHDAASPNYRLSATHHEINHLADLTIGSLALLGLTPQSPITVETP